MVDPMISFEIELIVAFVQYFILICLKTEPWPSFIYYWSLCIFQNNTAKLQSTM